MKPKTMEVIVSNGMVFLSISTQVMVIRFLSYRSEREAYADAITNARRNPDDITVLAIDGK